MDERLKRVGRRVLPQFALDRIRRRRHGLSDVEEAREFKRRFFWNAFRALDFNGIDGDYAEFGCHGGMTFGLAFAQIQRRKAFARHMWAFDSFEGLPAPSSPLDHHPVWQQGKMRTGLDEFQRICRAAGIPERGYTTVPGYYDQTLPPLGEDAPPRNIALAYVDCDLYSSTTTVLEYLVPRLKPGMIIAFDDYFCWSSDQISGERRAMIDVLGANAAWTLTRYRDYGWAGASFVVEPKQ